MAQLMATACCANDRQGIINGEKGYIVLDNINNPLKADIYSSDHILVDTQYAPQQITGFEYQVQACIDAISDGRTETEFMPHSESLEVMKIMDSLRKEWGVTFPNDSVSL
jgi:predicted dehydrogenase